MNMHSAIGAILGSIARIFQAICNAESGVPYEMLRDYRFYRESSLGSGYLHIFTTYVAGLAKPSLEAFMQTALEAKSFEAAKAVYEARFGLVYQACGCFNCTLVQSGKKTLLLA